MAVGKRLDTMLQAVTVVRSALYDYCRALSDEQKAQFEVIGPQRTAPSDPPETMQRHIRRHYVVDVGDSSAVNFKRSVMGLRQGAR